SLLSYIQNTKLLQEAISIFLQSYVTHRDLHYFPTRRSSDLAWPREWPSADARGADPWRRRVLRRSAAACCCSPMRRYGTLRLLFAGWGLMVLVTCCWPLGLARWTTTRAARQRWPLTGTRSYVRRRRQRDRSR